jgi:hypothetical protein
MGSNEVKTKDKRRDFTQRGAETQRTQRREERARCIVPLPGMVSCYDYA